MEKEFRVFVNDCNLLENTFNQNEINYWNDTNELSFEAIDFINKAEAEGRVFSLVGLQDAINNNSAIDMNMDYIFITNKY